MPFTKEQTIENIAPPIEWLKSKLSSGIPTVVADNVNHNRSHRHGSYVYYDPRNRGPYTDGQDALADVPTGGSLRLASTAYQVGTEGRLHADRGINIYGEGWWNDDQDNPDGTRVVNSQSEGGVVDQPSIEFSGTAKDEGGVIEGVYVQTEGDAPAVLVGNRVFNIIRNTIVRGFGNCHTGVKYANESFFGRAFNLKVFSASDRGIWIEHGPGFDHQFWGCQASIGSGANANARAFVTERKGTWIWGGQYDVNSGITGGVGVQWNQTSSDNEQGGGALGVTTENAETGFEVIADGTGRLDDIVVWRPRTHLGNQSTGMFFGDTIGSELYKPTVLSPTGGGDIAEWSADSDSCIYTLPAAGAENAPITPSGSAVDPLIRVPWSAPDGTLGNLPTGTVPVWVEYARSQGAPAFHDGTDWRSVSSTTFTP